MIHFNFPCALFIWLQPNCLKAWEIKIIAFSKKKIDTFLNVFSYIFIFPFLFYSQQENKFFKKELLSLFCIWKIRGGNENILQSGSKDKKMIYWLEFPYFCFIQFSSLLIRLHKRKYQCSIEWKMWHSQSIEKKHVSFAFTVWKNIVLKTLWRQTLKWSAFFFFLGYFL